MTCEAGGCDERDVVDHDGANYSQTNICVSTCGPGSLVGRASRSPFRRLKPEREVIEQVKIRGWRKPAYDAKRAQRRGREG